MNGRIKELASKAGLIQYKSDEKINDVERFAQLIIQECVSLMEEDRAYYANNDVLQDWCTRPPIKGSGVASERVYYSTEADWHGTMRAKEEAMEDAIASITYSLR